MTLRDGLRRAAPRMVQRTRRARPGPMTRKSQSGGGLPVRDRPPRAAPGSRAPGAGPAAAGARSSSVSPLSARTAPRHPSRSPCAGRIVRSGRRCVTWPPRSRWPSCSRGAPTPRPRGALLPAAPQARTEVAGAPLIGRVAVVGGLDGGRRRLGPRRPLRPAAPPLAAPAGPARGASTTRWRRRAASGSTWSAATGDRVAAGEASDRGVGALRPPLARAAADARAARRGRRGDRPQPDLRGRRVGPGGARPPGDVVAVPRPAHPALERLPPGSPAPREHLGVTALGGRVYADRRPHRRAWRPTPHAAEAYDPVAPRLVARCPTRPPGAAATAPRRAAGLVVAVGGEAPRRHDRAGRRLRPGRPARGASLTRSPRPRHGVAVVGIGRTVYQALGGPEPGLTVSRTLHGAPDPGTAGHLRTIAAGRPAGPASPRRGRRARGSGRPGRAACPAGRPTPGQAHEQAGLAGDELGGGDVDRAARRRARPSRRRGRRRRGRATGPASRARGCGRRARRAPPAARATRRRVGALHQQQLQRARPAGAAGREPGAVEPGPAAALGRSTPRPCRGRAPGRASRRPSSGPSASAIEVAKTGRPRLALRLPSIGSTTTTRRAAAARSRRSPASSLTTRERARRAASQLRDHDVLGDAVDHAP